MSEERFFVTIMNSTLDLLEKFEALCHSQAVKMQQQKAALILTAGTTKFAGRERYCGREEYVLPRSPSRLEQ